MTWHSLRHHMCVAGFRTRQWQFAVVAGESQGYNLGMSTLAEIEAVVDALPPADKQELLLFLVARLRAQAGQLPASRQFSSEQVRAWIAEDEADMQHFRDTQPK